MNEHYHKIKLDYSNGGNFCFVHADILTLECNKCNIFMCMSCIIKHYCENCKKECNIYKCTECNKTLCRNCTNEHLYINCPICKQPSKSLCLSCKDCRRRICENCIQQRSYYNLCIDCHSETKCQSDQLLCHKKHCARSYSVKNCVICKDQKNCNQIFKISCTKCNETQKMTMCCYHIKSKIENLKIDKPKKFELYICTNAICHKILCKKDIKKCKICHVKYCDDHIMESIICVKCNIFIINELIDIMPKDLINIIIDKI